MKIKQHSSLNLKKMWTDIVSNLDTKAYFQRHWDAILICILHAFQPI